MVDINPRRHSKMTTNKAANGGVAYNVTQQAARQIQHYRQGTGLVVNVHITHHGRTTVCHTLGHSPDGKSPSSNCNRPKLQITDFPARRPWTHAQTTSKINLVRKHYHMVGWEFGFLGHLPNPPLRETDWENPNLLSIIVMHDPISRLLASSGYIHKHFPNIPKGNATKQEWWDYANDPWFTNNYALRVLAGKECCDGANTDQKHLENARALVEHFSIVLDIECLTQGLKAVSSLLNITLSTPSG